MRDKPLILVVDDQATVVRIMASILKSRYDLAVATDGKTALRLAKERQPDLILLDMMMPGMSGIEVCEALQADADTRSIPVIFVTSMGDKHNEEIGLKVGAVDYITKPASPSIVRTRVNIHLAQHNQLQFIEKLASRELTDPEEIRHQALRLLNDAP